MSRWATVWAAILASIEIAADAAVMVQAGNAVFIDPISQREIQIGPAAVTQLGHEERIHDYDAGDDVQTVTIYTRKKAELSLRIDGFENLPPQDALTALENLRCRLGLSAVKAGLKAQGVALVRRHQVRTEETDFDDRKVFGAVLALDLLFTDLETETEDVIETVEVTARMSNQVDVLTIGDP